MDFVNNIQERKMYKLLSNKYYAEWIRNVYSLNSSVNADI